MTEINHCESWGRWWCGTLTRSISGAIDLFSRHGLGWGCRMQDSYTFNIFSKSVKQRVDGDVDRSM